MVEINDIAIASLPAVLRPETLMQGHWPLADHAEPYCRALDGVGVHQASGLLTLYVDGRVESLVRETGIPRLWLDTLRSLLDHHRYRAIPVSKLPGMPEAFHKVLRQRELRRSDALIMASRTREQRACLAVEAGVPVGEVDQLATFLDLTRKPGIKEVKAALFMSAGLRSLRDLGQQDPEPFRQQLETLIREKGLQRAVPTPKEVRSDVCWARVYPAIFDL